MSEGQITAFVDRLIRLNEERKSITDDIKDVCAEAKGQGYKPKALRALVAELMRDDSASAAASEHDAELDMYRQAYHASHVRVREAAE